jgi:hypothetical protein
MNKPFTPIKPSTSDLLADLVRIYDELRERDDFSDAPTYLTAGLDMGEQALREAQEWLSDQVPACMPLGEWTGERDFRRIA